MPSRADTSVDISYLPLGSGSKRSGRFSYSSTKKWIVMDLLPAYVLAFLPSPLLFLLVLPCFFLPSLCFCTASQFGARLHNLQHFCTHLCLCRGKEMFAVLSHSWSYRTAPVLCLLIRSKIHKYNVPLEHLKINVSSLSLGYLAFIQRQD